MEAYAIVASLMLGLSEVVREDSESARTPCTQLAGDGLTSRHNRGEPVLDIGDDHDDFPAPAGTGCKLADTTSHDGGDQRNEKREEVWSSAMAKMRSETSAPSTPRTTARGSNIVVNTAPAATT